MPFLSKKNLLSPTSDLCFGIETVNVYSRRHSAIPEPVYIMQLYFNYVKHFMKAFVVINMYYFCACYGELYYAIAKQSPRYGKCSLAHGHQTQLQNITFRCFKYL